MDIARHVREAAGIARTRELRARGATQSQIMAALNSGQIIRLRIGWFGLPDLPDHVVSAHRAGGPPACATIAAAHGLWMLRQPSLHVAVDSRESRQASRRVNRRGVVLHWIPAEFPRRGQALRDALRQLTMCLPELEAVCAIDSAVVRKRVAFGELCREASGPMLRVLSLCDGRAESGVESIFRLRASAAGFVFRSQVEVPGGRVDFLFGDRLVFEVDGEEFHAPHDAFVSDRERDAWHAAIGYYVVRLTYAQVVHRWHEVESLLTLLHARGEHLAPSRIRKSRRPAVC